MKQRMHSTCSVEFKKPLYTSLTFLKKMIHTDLFQYTWVNTGKIVRSHRLQPSNWITIFIILTGERESTVSVLEDHLLESVSTIEWDTETLSNDFTYISENFNHFMQNISEEERWWLGVVLWVLMNTDLVFSNIWETGVILVEQDGTVTQLSTHNQDKGEFQAISSGEILWWSHIYLSSMPLEERVSDDLIREISLLNMTEWKNIVWNIFKEEIQESVHIGCIHHESIIRPVRSHKTGKQLDILRETGSNILDGLRIRNWLIIPQELLLGFIDSRQRTIKYIFLWIGVLLLFSLTYLLLSAISSIITSPGKETKNQLIQAQELINNSQKIVNNPAAFNKMIYEAETILFELRNKRVHMSDTQDLLLRIEAMKKEVNDIQTINISKLNKLIDTANTSIKNIGAVEYDKKIHLIGEANSILWFVRGWSLPKEKNYPTGAIGKDFDISEDGTLFILTQEWRILTQRWNDFVHITSNNKIDWQVSNIIGTFNGNIYLATPDKKWLNRYKPWINGFSWPTTIISGLENQIIDIWIDGWIYLLLQDGKVIRYIWWTSWSQKNLVINKVPWEYNIWSEEITQLYTKTNLSYVYILSGKNIWIFSPDSKRFQDVTAWNYIAQLELQTIEDIKNISIPRDWIIYITTTQGVYELIFEIADSKIILR